MEENWRPVPGWESTHIVSDLGRVATLDRVDARGYRRQGRILKSGLHSKQGHLRVALQHMFRREVVGVHRLVLLAFVGPCPPGMEGLHANDVPDDNRLVNLRWGTPKENVADAIRNGRRLAASQITECVHGHPFTPENTYVFSGRRECRTCRLARNNKNRPAMTPESRARKTELQRLRRARKSAA